MRRFRRLLEPATAGQCLVMRGFNSPEDGRILARPEAWRTLPPKAYTPVLRCLACVILAERASLVTIALVQEHVTVWAKIFILYNPWAADREKSHGCLLLYVIDLYKSGLTGT